MNSNSISTNPQKLLSPKEVEEYTKMIQERRITKEKIFNKGGHHASIFLSNIFENTKDNLYILSNTLASEVANFDDYKNELLRCINNPAISVKILLVKDIDTSTETYKELSKLYNSTTIKPKNLTIKKLNSAAEAQLKSEFNNNVPNYAVGDTSFRFEDDLGEFKAFGHFNLGDKNGLIRVLVERFNRAFEIADTLNTI
jgi:hypothetical protein